jgi:hypothetical protein
MAWIGIETTPEPARINADVLAGWAITVVLLVAYLAVVIAFGDEITGGLARALHPRVG